MKYAFLLITLIIIEFILVNRQSSHFESSNYKVAQVQLPHPSAPPLPARIASEALADRLIKGEGGTSIGLASIAPLSFIRRGVGGEVIEAPIAEFFSRITKKPFGIYITPETSPVQPDRWTGYHTGVDIEYEDIPGDVPVRAIADGEIVLNKFATGYGGVVVIRHNINGQDILALYGHLDPHFAPTVVGASRDKPHFAPTVVGASRDKPHFAPTVVGASRDKPHLKYVNQGQIIGILGQGYTEETDGARKHLHFSLIKKDVDSTGSPQALDIRGYVKTQEELAGWYDPEEFYSIK